MFCGECGSQVSDSAKFCRSCGKPIAPPSASVQTSNIAPQHSAVVAPQQFPVAVAVAPARDTEMTFLQKDGVRVTSTRFIVPGQTFAMAGVTSVRSVKIEPDRKGPSVLLGVGLLILLIPILRVIGVMFLIAAILWFIVQKTTFAVGLNSASGETHAITNEDAGYIDSIVNALNEAIVYRR